MKHISHLLVLLLVLCPAKGLSQTFANSNTATAFTAVSSSPLLTPSHRGAVHIDETTPYEQMNLQAASAIAPLSARSRISGRTAAQINSVAFTSTALMNNGVWRGTINDVGADNPNAMASTTDGGTKPVIRKLPDHPEDPFKDPVGDIGDISWVAVLLAALAYTVYSRYRRQRTAKQ